ncbi:MAG: sugar phosphate isomerase/epimerase [Planctomycetota bacterium]|nr:sugar phosphate isomerase/epimerase [Planctomycetota bacterium]
MPAAALTDTSKLCVHTITTKPLSLDEALEAYPRAGVRGITVWRQALEGRNPAASGKRIREAGLSIVSLCRGGFFPAREASRRQAAIDENRRIVDEAAALGAPLVVLVCGAVPGQPLGESRAQIRDGIAAVADHARACGVKLAVEPLHPMYADDRSAINTLRQANDLCEALDHPAVGVAADVYHLWWDPELEAQIARCGRAGRLWAFHICDWKTPTEDLLNDRGLMGEGCIDLRGIRGWVEAAGFGGFNEVEVFSNRRWKLDQRAYLEEIRKAYLERA